MAEDTTRRLSPCKWIDRDDHGRPRCEHGWAHRDGNFWGCPRKHTDRTRRYRATEAGRVARLRENQTEHAKVGKQIYDLTRIRMGR